MGSTLKILLVTNLYPPQELGGYGRCMSDFCWGLQQRGHQITVLSHNAPYLGRDSDGPNGESVQRSLKLKGSFNQGVTMIQEPAALRVIDRWNLTQLQGVLQAEPWDAFLVGNLDLLGPELLKPLIATGKPVVHHVGFIAAPFPAVKVPEATNYRIATASKAVQSS